MASPVVLAVTRLDQTLRWSWSGIGSIQDLDSVQKLTLHVTDSIVATVANPDADSHLKRYNIADLTATSFTVPTGDLTVGSKYYGRLFVEYVDTNADEQIVGSNIAPAGAANDADLSALVSQLGVPTVDVVTGHQEITVTFTNFTSALTGDEDISTTKFVIVYSEAQGDVALEKVVVPIASMTKVGDDYSYTITGLDNLVRYEVSAYFANAIGNSTAVNTYATPSEIPSAPTSLVASTSTTNNLQIDVTWVAPVLSTNDASIDFYRIYRSVGDDQNYSKLLDVSGDVTSYTDGDSETLTNGETYYYKVAAMRLVSTDLGEVDIVDPTDDNLIIGAESNEDSALSMNLVANAPGAVLSVIQNDETVYLEITKPNNVDSSYLNDPQYSAVYKITFNVTEQPSTAPSQHTKNVTFDGSATQTVSYTDFAVFGDSVNAEVALEQTIGAFTALGAVGYANSDDGGINVNDVTLFSTPAAVTNLVSTPVELVGADYQSLSTAGNGVLRLQWTHTAYDTATSGLGGKFTNDIRYEVLLNGASYSPSYSAIVPVVGQNTVDVEGLTLGQAQTLSVVAYFLNSESNNTIVGDESAAVADSNIPFLQPTAAGIALSLDASGESIAAQWESVTATELGQAPNSYFKQYTAVYTDTTNSSVVYDTPTTVGEISNNTVDGVDVYDQAISGLTNGVKYSVTVNFTIEYLDSVHGTIQISTADGVAVTRTPYSDPLAPTPTVTFYDPAVDFQAVSTVASGGKLWVQWSDISYDYVNGQPGEFSNLLKYRITVVNESGSLEGDQVLNDVTSTTVVTGLTLGATYTVTMTSYYQNPEEAAEVESSAGDSGASIASFRTPFAPPSQPSLDPLIETNQQLEANWGAASDNGLAVSGYYITITGSAQEDLGNVQTKTFSSLSNGVEYTVTLIAYSSFTGTSDGTSIVDERYESVVSSGVTGIPFDRPIVSSDSLVTSNSLELQFTNNGRQLREVLIVAIPEDSNSNQDIAVVQYTGASFSASAWNDANNTDTSLVTRTITESLPYDCKAVLWVIENEAGSTVGTVGTIDA